MIVGADGMIASLEVKSDRVRRCGFRDLRDARRVMRGLDRGRAERVGKHGHLISALPITTIDADEVIHVKPAQGDR